MSKQNSLVNDYSKPTNKTPSFIGNFQNKTGVSLIQEKKSIIRINDMSITVKDNTGDIVDDWVLPFKQHEITRYTFQTLTLEGAESVNLLSWNCKSLMIQNQSNIVYPLRLEIVNEYNKSFDLDFSDFFSWKSNDHLTSLKVINLSDDISQTIKVLLFK